MTKMEKICSLLNISEEALALTIKNHMVLCPSDFGLLDMKGCVDCDVCWHEKV